MITPDATLTCDLNCDLGENDQRVRDGTDLLLLDIVTSANVACGGHAGDTFTMTAIARAALERRVAIGAHPSYPDRPNFGRISIPMTPAQIEQSVRSQILDLARIVESLGARLSHVKPHGALYHDAMHDPAIGTAIAAAVLCVDPALVLVAMSGSEVLSAWRAQGLRVAGEAFADRAYEPDGSLRSRSLPGALITDPAAAAAQAIRFVRDGVPHDPAPLRPQTICVHGDTPSAVLIACAVRSQLESAGVRVAPVHTLPA